MDLKFGKNLRKLRRRKGITQEQLADILEVTPQAVSRWENEDVYPSIQHFVTLANYFSVTIDELVGDIDCALTPSKCGDRPERNDADLLDESIRVIMTVLSALIEEKENISAASDGEACEHMRSLDEQLRRVRAYF